MSNHVDKYWIAIMSILLLCLISGGTILAIKLSSRQPAEISLNSTNPPDYRLDVYIDGAVASPGYYPARTGDSITNIVQAAGLTPDANLNQLKIYVPNKTEPNSQKKPQKISLNLADAWLFQSLPGIGQAKAQAIIDYRNKYGAFRRTEDVLKVNGISKSIFDTIRNLITVED
jgi:competence protein ComEA